MLSINEDSLLLIYNMKISRSKKDHRDSLVLLFIVLLL